MTSAEDAESFQKLLFSGFRKKFPLGMFERA